MHLHQKLFKWQYGKFGSKRFQIWYFSVTGPDTEFFSFRLKKARKNRNSPSPAYEINRVGKNVRQSFSILGDRDLTQPVSILPEKQKPKTYNCFPMSCLCFATDSRLQNVASYRLLLCPVSSCLFVTISLSNVNWTLHVFPQALTFLVLSSIKHNLYCIILYIF